MGRAPCCDKSSVKKGPWSPEEDKQLKDYIEKHGTGGNWIAFPHKAGLKRCGKSCRLRWLNYLRPNLKHGDFSPDEDMIICNLYASIGSRWSIIASQLPGRTDNDIKNYWNTKLKKKLLGIPPLPRKQQQQQQLDMSQVIDTRPAAIEAIISSAAISPNLINSLASSLPAPLLQNCSFFATDQDQYSWQRGAEPVELFDHNHLVCGGDTTLTQRMLLGDSSSPSVSFNFASNSEEVKPLSAAMLSRISEGNCLDGDPNCYSSGAGEVRFSAAPAAGRCMYFY